MQVGYNDGSSEAQSVTWAAGAELIEGAGTYTFAGTTSAGLATTATVVVSAANHLANPGFEATDVSRWTVTGTGLALRATDDPHSGTRSAHFYSDSAYSFTLSQQVTGLAPGSYSASAFLQGDGEDASSTATVTLSTASSTSSAPFALDGWQQWSNPTAGPIDVAAGETVTVTVALTLPAGAWGTLDDLSLVLDDGARQAPARGQLSQDNGWDTGLADGDYTVTMNLWWGENASLLRVYENGVLIANKPLSYAGVSAQSALIPVAGRPNGSYVYTGELVNSKGTTTLSPVTVAVTQAAPGAPVISHDNWDRNGDFTLTGNLWWGTNATSYRFLLGETVVGSGSLVAATPTAQSAKLEVTGMAPGTYRYTVEFTNAAGTSTSGTFSVVVTG